MKRIKQFFISLFKREVKQALCKHEWRQFGHQAGDPLDPNNPWCFCEKCKMMGLIDDKFWNSNL